MRPTRFSLTAACLSALLCSCTTAPAPTVSPAQLVGSSWHVFGLNAGGVHTRSMTISFQQDGRVTGNAACNDYHATYTIEGNRLRFGKAVSLTTDRRCDDDTVETEERFIATLGRVRSASIAPSGSLVLYTDTSNRLVARRL